MALLFRKMEVPQSSQLVCKNFFASIDKEGRGLGWRIHESVEDTKLSTNKQHTLSQKHKGTKGRPKRTIDKKPKDTENDVLFLVTSRLCNLTLALMAPDPSDPERYRIYSYDNCKL